MNLSILQLRSSSSILFFGFDWSSTAKTLQKVRYSAQFGPSLRFQLEGRKGSGVDAICWVFEMGGWNWKDVKKTDYV